MYGPAIGTREKNVSFLSLSFSRGLIITTLYCNVYRKYSRDSDCTIKGYDYCTTGKKKKNTELHGIRVDIRTYTTNVIKTKWSFFYKSDFESNLSRSNKYLSLILIPISLA